MELMIDCGVFVATQRIPRDRRHLRGRCQPRRATSDGSGAGRRSRSCETTTLQSARCLSDDGAVPEFVDDRTSNVACVPATSESNFSQDSSQVVLRCAYSSCGSGNGG